MLPAVDHRCYLPRVALAGNAHLLSGNHDEALCTFSEAYRIKPDLSGGQVDLIVGCRLGVGLKRLSV
ncbi:MAG: hypothetical protein R3E46_14680 [Sedimenticolaceae bacterium]